MPIGIHEAAQWGSVVSDVSPVVGVLIFFVAYLIYLGNTARQNGRDIRSIIESGVQVSAALECRLSKQRKEDAITYSKSWQVLEKRMDELHDAQVAMANDIKTILQSRR